MSTTFDGDNDPEAIERAIGRRIAAVDSDVAAFRLRNRYRDGVGSWIVSIAVPQGHRCDEAALEAAARELGMRVEGFFEYVGDLQDAIRNDLGEPPTRDGLPITNEDQSCVFCDDPKPMWVHPLDENLTGFRSAGTSWTLPTFWTICERCEGLVAEGRDRDLAQLFFDHEADSMDEACQVVETFRAADLGAHPLVDRSELN